MYVGIKNSSNNYVDITSYIAYGGLKWSRNDVDSPSTGRALSGLMYRGRVATKIRLDITCRLLTKSEAQTILSLIQPEFVTVKYDDPMTGTQVEKTMYSNNNPAVFEMKTKGNVEWWGGVTFPLVER